MFVSLTLGCLGCTCFCQVIHEELSYIWEGDFESSIKCHSQRKIWEPDVNGEHHPGPQVHALDHKPTGLQSSWEGYSSMESSGSPRPHRAALLPSCTHPKQHLNPTLGRESPMKTPSPGSWMIQGIPVQVHHHQTPSAPSTAPRVPTTGEPHRLQLPEQPCYHQLGLVLLPPGKQWGPNYISQQGARG